MDLVRPTASHKDELNSSVLISSALSSQDTSVNQASLQLTRSLDQFQVLAEVGNGSFGSVFKAKHLETGKVVRIDRICARIVPPRALSDPRFTHPSCALT